MATKTTIVIHCSATPGSRAVKVSEIDGWHKAQRFEPYVNKEGKKIYCGYHYIVHQDGRVENVRPPEARGQHCPQGSMNNRGISICYIGGVDNNNQPLDTRTQAQKVAIAELVAELRAKFGHLPVMGHRDIPGVKKACPCFDAKREYNNIAKK